MKNRLYILYIIGYQLNDDGSFNIYSNNEVEREFLERELGAITENISLEVNKVHICGKINYGDVLKVIPKFTKEDIFFMVRYYKEVMGLGRKKSIHITPRCDYSYSIILALFNKIREFYSEWVVEMDNGVTVIIRNRAYERLLKEMAEDVSLCS